MLGRGCTFGAPANASVFGTKVTSTPFSLAGGKAAFGGMRSRRGGFDDDDDEDGDGDGDGGLGGNNATAGGDDNAMEGVESSGTKGGTAEGDDAGGLDELLGDDMGDEDMEGME